MSKETLKLEIEKLKLIKENSILRHKQRMEALEKKIELAKLMRNKK